jgi:3-methyladenine DNA glycosylase Tag
MRRSRTRRCPWAKTEKSVLYHDTEWGVPAHEDLTLFELLVLEGAQAGLSWETILNKRESYREAFDQFDPAFSRAASVTPNWRSQPAARDGEGASAPE